jgi:hypothetical protein
LSVAISDRNDRDNLHVVRIDDNDLVLIDEVEEAAPLGLDPHKCLGHRDDMNSLARNYRSDSDVEVDVTDPRRAMRIDDSSADLGALLLVKLHVHAGGGVRAFRAVSLLSGGIVAAIAFVGVLAASPAGQAAQ